MSNPRTPLDELMLSGSPNIGRALKREKAETDVTLTPDQRSEIEKLDELIALTIKACKKGSTKRGRRNPAFQNLSVLVKTRDLLLKGRKPSKRSTQEILAEADKMMGIN
jgi:hypothetical protein